MAPRIANSKYNVLTHILFFFIAYALTLHHPDRRGAADRDQARAIRCWLATTPVLRCCMTRDACLQNAVGPHHRLKSTLYKYDRGSSNERPQSASLVVVHICGLPQNHAADLVRRDFDVKRDIASYIEHTRCASTYIKVSFLGLIGSETHAGCGVVVGDVFAAIIR